MKKRLLWIFLPLLALGGFWAWQPAPQNPPSARLTVPQSDAVLTGFARLTAPHPFEPSRDFGAHPNYQTEWWYYTGNLQTAEGRHFGYQFTIFRRALLPPNLRAARASSLAADQIYMAHFALTDSAGGKHYAFERFERGDNQIAGAESPPYRVWLQDWQVRATAPNVYHMHAAQDGIAITFTLTDTKGSVLHGNAGYSQKGPDPGNASFYHSQTRLQTAGSIQINAETFNVRGLSWKDQEYSTSALAPDQIGWDWFALQLDDGSELKVFHIRKADGSIDPFSAGSYIAPDGSLTPLQRDDFEIIVKDYWQSPRTEARYPARWVVRVPSLGIELNLQPTLPDQELNVSYAYWEGAVRLTGQIGATSVSGFGYVEMTGYAGSMAGQF
ncbi:MAG: lipocalin-like domain-containing protein [Anaerolineales bacterium]